MQVLYLGRAPRTKETLPDFLKWRRVTQRPLVFRGLTGSQRTPGFRASHSQYIVYGKPRFWRSGYSNCAFAYSRFGFFLAINFPDISSEVPRFNQSLYKEF